MDFASKRTGWGQSKSTDSEFIPIVPKDIIREIRTNYTPNDNIYYNRVITKLSNLQYSKVALMDNKLLNRIIADSKMIGHTEVMDVLEELKKVFTIEQSNPDSPIAPALALATTMSTPTTGGKRKSRHTTRRYRPVKSRHTRRRK